MIKNNDQISPYQLGMLIIMTVVGVGIFSLPADIAKTAGTDAWIMIILGGVINLPFALIMVKLNSRFPGKTFIEYSQEILGKIPGKIVAALFATSLLIVVSFVIRTFTEVIRMFMLFRTPTEIILLTMIITCTYIIRGGVECVGRIMEVTFPLLFIPFFLIFLPGMADLDYENIRPILYHFPTKIMKSLSPMILSYAAYECILFYIGFMKEPKKAYKPVLYAMAFITFLYTFITMICLANFGDKFLAQILWPVLLYVKGINLPGLFLERLDGVMLALWVVSIFTTIVSIYFICTYTISKVIGTKEQKQYVLPLSIIIYYISLQPQDIAQLFKWTQWSIYVEAVFIFIVPTLLLLISFIRGKGEQPSSPAKDRGKGGLKDARPQKTQKG